MKRYFNKRKYDMFPEVKDWSDPKPELRFEKNIKDMGFYDWLWFHPSAYSLLHFGYPFVCIALFAIATLLIIKIPILPLFSGLCGLYFIYDAYKKLRNREHMKLITMSDIYLRDDVYVGVNRLDVKLK